jgi:hypothetical protein
MGPPPHLFQLPYEGRSVFSAFPKAGARLSVCVTEVLWAKGDTGVMIKAHVTNQKLWYASKDGTPFISLRLLIVCVLACRGKQWKKIEAAKGGLWKDPGGALPVIDVSRISLLLCLPSLFLR